MRGAEVARIYNIDNPGEAARSIEQLFPKMFGVEISARQVQAYWDYREEFEAQQRQAGKPFRSIASSTD